MGALHEDHRAKMIATLDSHNPLCYMTVIHLKPVTTIVKEIFDETIMFDLILTLSEGHRAKLVPPLVCQATTLL